MTRQELIDYVNAEGIVLLDGATGTNLQRRGMPSGVCPEQWMTEHEDVIRDLKEGYIASGTKILYAPTFGANRIKLGEYGLEHAVTPLNTRLVQLAKEAAAPDVLVAGDLTMTGKQLQPVGTLSFDELTKIYCEQITALADAGADLLIVETMMSLQECRAALIAAKEVSDLAVMVTLTFEADGRTLFGNDPASCAATLEALGAAAVGTNCGAGPDRMEDAIRQMAAVTSIPVIAKPNAGLPKINEAGETVYSMDADAFVAGMETLIGAGARIVGGCCGTDPDYIRALHDRVEAVKKRGIPEAKRRPEHMRILTAERRALCFQPGDPFLVIGERINPTGKKQMQQELLAGQFDTVCTFAEQQEADGAAVLDVNVGMSGIDETTVMCDVIDEVTQVSNLPLCIDTSNAETMEAALRRYPGRALMNSVSLEKDKVARLFPLAKRYGAMVLLLPVGPKGLPKSPEEKHAFIDELVRLALEEGLSKQDLVVDALVATIAADKDAAENVLATIRYCRQNDLATVCGLSNISFGLPGRSFVNAAFLSMAISAGLNLAIANPSQALLMNTFRAADLLMHKPDADSAYISQIERYEASEAEQKPVQTTALKPKKNEVSAESGAAQIEDADLKKVYLDVLHGNQRTIESDTLAAVANGLAAKEVLDKALMPAIQEVGELFDKGRFFLPQLIAGAEAMERAIACIEPELVKEKRSDKDMPVIVIATVQGDIHDIGKNLVTLMLKNYGFRVHDLGKDVPAKTIIEKAKEVDADIIALSALMTTTMQEMEHVVNLARKNGLRAKIMIGGAVVTPEYADEISADAYSSDAQDAVKVAQEILKIRK